MVGLGTIVNTGVIVAGGLLGLAVKKGIPERFKETVMQAIGLAVLIIGVSGALQGIYTIVEGARLDRQFIMLMILSMVIGGLIGEGLNIEKRLEALGRWIQSRFAGKGENSFVEGFVTTSLIYCVGAMAIVGSLEDGLLGNPTTLFAKSLLDGISAVIFSATLGIGVVFSAFSVLVYQGAITVLAGFIKPWLTDLVIAQTSLVGGILIMGIGMQMLGMTKIKVGNLLPAMAIPLAAYLLFG